MNLECPQCQQVSAVQNVSAVIASETGPSNQSTALAASLSRQAPKSGPVSILSWVALVGGLVVMAVLTPLDPSGGPWVISSVGAVAWFGIFMILDRQHKKRNGHFERVKADRERWNRTFYCRRCHLTFEVTP
jgi:hypothetical protein